MLGALKLTSNLVRCSTSFARSSQISSYGLQARSLLTGKSFQQLRIHPKDSSIVPKRISISNAARSVNTSAGPEKGRKIVGTWLLGCSGMVFVAVILGGTLGYIALVYSICFILSKTVEVTSKKA